MYQFKSRVRYSETDLYGGLTIESLINYFQDCSTFQSEDLGLGVSYLKQFHLAWVLSAWQIVIKESPVLGENITIGTFPYEFRKFMGFRNFFMTKENGVQTACANSIWTLIDTSTLRPVMPSPAMLKGYSLEERLDMDYAPRKILQLENGERMEEIVIKKHHLDSNYHVNNAKYITMAMDCVAMEEHIGQIRVEYKKQAVLHDRIVPIVSSDGQRQVVSLCHPAGEPYAVVEFQCR